MQITLDFDEYERDYDTDEVSVTSTIPADQAEDVEYDVDCIISEGQDPETGESRYLIKWIGYPLHECTWEPAEHFAGTSNLLHHWNAQKLEMGDEAFQKMVIDHYDLFEEAKEKANKAKARRQIKRVKKRRKIGLLGQARNNVRQLEDGGGNEMPSLSSSTRDTSPHEKPVKGEPVIPKPIQRKRLSLNKRVSVTSASSSEAPSDTDSDTTQDSLLEEISSTLKKAKPARDKQKVSRPAELSASSQKDHNKQNGPTTVSSATERPQEKPPKASNYASSGRDSEKRTGSSSTATSLNNKDKSNSAKKVISSTISRPPASEPVTRTIRSKNTNAVKVPRPIKIINEPKSRPKEWKSFKLYRTLQSQNKGRKHFQAEGTPDPTSLEFVNGAPTGRPPPRAPSTNPLPSTENLFGRRESGLRRAFETSSPPPSPKRPLQPFEIGKIPLVCFDYRSGNNCRYSSKDCRFMHRDASPSGRKYKVADWNGRVPGKYANPPQTCRFWLRGIHGCTSSAEDCDFAHTNTGLLASAGGGGRAETIDLNEVPLTDRAGPSAETRTTATNTEKNLLICWYWLKNPYGCSKTAEICGFAHWNTGMLATQDGGRIRVDPMEKPSFTKPDGLTCFFWNQFSCSFTPSQCRYLHEYTGIIAKPPGSWVPMSKNSANAQKRFRYRDQTTDQFTCYLWTQGLCRKPQESCHFLHFWTDNVADPPPGFVKPPSGSTVQQNMLQPLLSNAPPQDMAEPTAKEELLHADQDEAGVDVPMVDANSPETSVPAPAPPVLSVQIDVENPPENVCTMRLKERIENACKLDFQDMFVYNGVDDRDAILDKRAFLIFHPEYHTEELEVLTRWLLIHHVEVYNFWADGAWTAFREEIAQGGSGIIIAHPDFELYAEIPGFFQVLAAKVRIWSIGHQAGFEFDLSVPAVFPPSSIQYRYDRIEIFPHGGIIYITDDVFFDKPQQAMTIIQHFFAKIQACRAVDGPTDPWRLVNDGFLPWRLGVRPELIQYLHDNMEADGPLQQARCDLYQLLSGSPYIDHPNRDANLSRTRPDDYFPIISERREFVEDVFFTTPDGAPRSDSVAATTKMVEYFGGMVMEQRQSYRRFFVVHTQPDAVAARDWKKRIGTLEEVLTPEQCIEIFEGDPKGSRFDFFEWAFEKKAAAAVASGGSGLEVKRDEDAR